MANIQGLQVNIVSPEKTLYAGPAESVTVPGRKGCFEILRNHAPIISTLSSGTVSCRGVENFSIQVSGGFVEVAHNEVSVCVEIESPV